jgi:ABC-2 type transport system permease protein
LVSIPVDATSALATIGVLALMAVSLSAFGFCLAWRMDSTQGFHAIMMLILLPMWFLSGAFFPAQGLPTVLSWMVSLNPLTYALSLVRRVLYMNFDSTDLPSFTLSLIVTSVFLVVTVLLSWYMASENKKSI